ncbi:late blight resistance homolog R1B-17 [Olea europaea subsp. europaea]|uniref:Late blight resistance homolog R1B-17 n=1 Tax=Olea europaea subsp. europaea TaxID=158383 RepID=A0A8S0PX72_OLEEU|nr:late blight resistance homolog R1B-17 [Olea europaea subsp. europaea]
MAGIGKTTLAKKVYHDPAIEFEFYNRGWVSASQDCNRKEVFLAILDQMTKVIGEMRNMTEENLGQKLHGCLEKEKYLIVIDDVWTQQDWNYLQVAFPKNKKKSRTLLSNRSTNVGYTDKCKLEHHNLCFLNDDESWKLLQRKALGFEECPQELIILGKQIAAECDGLPLTIVVIGGILLQKRTKRDICEDVSKNVKEYIIEMDHEKTIINVISWSFNQLPYDLKVCVLNFGMLPEDYRISARKLIRLWIAKGFIQQNEETNLENVAEDYLENLEKWRILDGEPICFNRFPADLGHVVNLRYLVLSIQFKILPKCITKLWNMQTLIVKTSSNALEIRGDISKMVRPRHLETNASTSFSDSFIRKRNNEEGSLTNLRTISTISPETRAEDVFDRAPNLISPPEKLPPNLKMLTLNGTKLDWKYMSTLGMLENLEILKLKENAFEGDCWEPKNGGFPSLKLLHIGRTDLVNWVASDSHFPSLKSFHLKHYTYLNTIPIGLSNIETLQTMDLY